MRVEGMNDGGPDKFAFGSIFDGSVPIERGATAHVRFFVDERDAKAILANVRDAANRSEFVLVSLHCHEGTEDNWYSPRAASFIEDFERKAIDPGATMLVGHGPHMLRGIEIYKRRPIFYSLNGLLMEFEAGEHKMTPEMFEAFGFSRDALPSDLQMSRAHDANGNPVGLHANPKFSRACVAICDCDTDGVAVKLVPIDLGLGSQRATARGLPAWAAPQFARKVADEMTKLSEYYGTVIKCNDADGTLTVSGR